MSALLMSKSRKLQMKMMFCPHLLYFMQCQSLVHIIGEIFFPKSPIFLQNWIVNVNQQRCKSEDASQDIEEVCRNLETLRRWIWFAWLYFATADEAKSEWKEGIKLVGEPARPKPTSKKIGKISRKIMELYIVKSHFWWLVWTTE
jgi:hypothetical protein